MHHDSSFEPAPAGPLTGVVSMCWNQPYLLLQPAAWLLWLRDQRSTAGAPTARAVCIGLEQEMDPNAQRNIHNLQEWGCLAVFQRVGGWAGLKDNWLLVL